MKDDPRLAFVDMQLNTLVVGAERVRLQPRQAEIVHLLLEAYPNALSRIHITENLVGLWGHDDIDAQGIDVQICRIRQLTGHLPLQIKTARQRGFYIEFRGKDAKAGSAHSHP